MRTWRPPSLLKRDSQHAHNGGVQKVWRGAGEGRTRDACPANRTSSPQLRHLEDGLRQRSDRPEAVGRAPLPDPPTDDPNYVMVDLEFDSESEADGLSSGLSANGNLGGLSPGFSGVEARVVGAARLNTPSAAVSATAKAKNRVWAKLSKRHFPLGSRREHHATHGSATPPS
jgi:hypothetical protein